MLKKREFVNFSHKTENVCVCNVVWWNREEKNKKKWIPNDLFIGFKSNAYEIRIKMHKETVFCCSRIPFLTCQSMRFFYFFSAINDGNQ